MARLARRPNAPIRRSAALVRQRPGPRCALETRSFDVNCPSASAADPPFVAPRSSADALPEA
ncbi:hypothetical protein CQW49_18790 [Methylosinus trichosporium OB3b]|uniref:Uncharacterized protein n=1 Tax=Methylosinus trichosporium (strain ATCC 35070 / NCIMB 11131 / UNIQEM 75 / OB3b) TaxID=595536 RepID=A0A2D2D3W7_METT3|nr:hypothetical protein CQW49_18790 [Methylosinus trichosporium OB3b]OBS51213.1 hypothetical protein A8B73_17305 [Methylosinus sp. 3S-1]